MVGSCNPIVTKVPRTGAIQGEKKFFTFRSIHSINILLMTWLKRRTWRIDSHAGRYNVTNQSRQIRLILSEPKSPNSKSVSSQTPTTKRTQIPIRKTMVMEVRTQETLLQPISPPTERRLLPEVFSTSANPHY